MMSGTAFEKFSMWAMVSNTWAAGAWIVRETRVVAIPAGYREAGREPRLGSGAVGSAAARRLGARRAACDGPVLSARSSASRRWSGEPDRRRARRFPAG